ncbi:hypothetical protein PQX77_010963 [Marasmius sp. AFHP31]|nr:hypothetical protein PQX77_010963 [Marasmius sp. AFHP31]
MNRPPGPGRLPSFSKRHASFDSPREIPLPSPLALDGGRDGRGYFDIPKVDGREEVRKEMKEREREKAHSHSRSYHHTHHHHHSKESNHSRESHPSYQHHSPHSSIDRSTPPPPPPLHEPTTPTATTTTTTKPIFPHPRPYSLPHSSSSSSSSGGSETQFSTPNEHEPSSLGLGLGKPDRSSSASLPLPAQIPYHTLPRAQLDGSLTSGSGSVSRNGKFFREPPPLRPPPAPPHSASGSFALASSSGSGAGMGTGTGAGLGSKLPYLEDDEEEDTNGGNYMTALRPKTKHRAGLASHPPVILEEGASGLARSSSVGSAHAQVTTPVVATASASTPTPITASTSTSSSNSATSSSSAFTPSTSEEVWRNPPPVQPPGPRTTPSPRPVLGGVVNPSDLPPVLPPQRMRGAGGSSSVGNPSSRVGHGSGSGGGGGTTTMAIPPPLPHTPPNPFSQTQTPTMMTPTLNNPPAYAPFLSPLPPPPERCWVEVETTPREYKLNIRLEGFKRDGITLATRRRRILHVVADSWDTEGGGHFERRISFGYDADLVGVRAEFDGEWLRVSVPRRLV